MKTLRQQAGYTLIEVLVATTLTLAIFGATLTLLDVYARQAQGSTQRNDAQDRARVGIDLIVRQLRNISSPISSPKLIERATPYDIVFQTVGTPSGSNVSGAQRVRYCMPADTSSGSPANEVLVSQTQTWTTATPPTSPWTPDPTQTIACPDASTSSSVTVAPSVTNRYRGRTDRPAFSFNNGSAPSDLGTITSVQIDLFVNPTPTALSPAETELRSAAYLRNQERPPSVSFTSTATGGGGVLLNGGTSYSPDGEDLSYAWSCTAPSLCPNSAALAATNTGLVDWQPGTGTYTVQLTVTDAGGLSATTTQQVTVS
jgi:hypothetical protein